MTALLAAPRLREERETPARVLLTTGWEMASAEDARSPDALTDLRFMPAHVPGTVASALRGQGVLKPGGDACNAVDAGEYWFRCRFDSEPSAPGEEIVLEMDGIATLSEAWLNGRRILKSSSMFARHRPDVSRVLGRHNELLIVCRSLTAALRERRGQLPRGRWRTRLVGDQQLRWFRTTLLGRAPGFASGPAPVGPWRPVALVRRRHAVLEHWSRHAEVDGSNGTVRMDMLVRTLQPDVRPVSGWLQSGEACAPMEWQESGDRYTGQGILRLPDVRRWWPHNLGEPALYPLRVELQLSDGSTAMFDDVPVGFRSLKFKTVRGSQAGFEVNGVPVFCRGVVWTPPDAIAFTTDDSCLRRRLSLLRDGGFNLIRLAGTTVYEDETFHSLCDDLGLLIWQDMMFANMDYPFADAAFLDAACSEAESELSRLARHASSAMVCGNSEVEQQVGMLGLDVSLGRGPFFGDELPRIAARCCPGLPYITSAPSGGDLPFRTRSGVANYFGVGAYLRPLEDVRRADIGFASECLAFANVPEPEAIEKMALTVPGGISAVHPAWKRGVPRDAGAGWDFDDVRDHYLKLLYTPDPAMLRHSDTQHYLELSRLVSGEVMAEVFGEWRRPGSRCGGGVILWSADLEPGAGWGILDSEGCPKAAYWFLKRALNPCAIWTTDEGLNGVDLHVANDGPAEFEGIVRIALYRHGEQKIDEAEREIAVGAHGSVTFGFEQILGRFVDASCAYRFGPAGHDLIAGSLHLRHGDMPLAQCFRFPAGRTAQKVPISGLGIKGQATAQADGSVKVLLSSRCFANGVRVTAANGRPDDCYFGIEPGGARRVVLTPSVAGALPAGVHVTAVNAEGRLAIPMERRA